MARSITLAIGGRSVELFQSETQIAVKPRVGMERSMDNQLRSMARRVPVERRGSLEGFEIVEIEASPEVQTRARTTLRDAASVDQEVPVYHTSDDLVPFVPGGTIYLSFEGGTSDRDKQDLLRTYALELLTPEPNGFLTVRVSHPRGDAVEVAARLQAEAIVATAEPDLITTRRLDGLALPSDELLARQWHLENTGSHGGQTLGYKQGADARVIAAWRLLDGLGSGDVVVGVIDDGFDLGHPDLSEKSVHPWDFERNSSDVRPEPDASSPARGNWHGTSCAGVAVGKAEGGQIVGAAPNARLMPVRMNDSLSPPLVARWFDHMTERGAWVISCSWGAEAKVYPLPDRIAHAIARSAREGRQGRGCVVVFAAGNSGSKVNDLPSFLNGYAVHPDVIAVSACTSMDESSSYSNFGREISVCAPSGGRGAWSITTSDVRGTYLDAEGVERSSGYVEGDYNYFFSGTSSACPLVAGVCALILSADPDLTSAEVRELIQRTARRIGAEADYQDGHSPRFGFGCVDAERAVETAQRTRMARDDAQPGRHRRAAASRAAGAAPDAARAALPNLFEDVIAEALEDENATPQSVAAAIASSDLFLKAVSLGMNHQTPPEGVPTTGQIVRSKLAKAISAPTAGTMFDRDPS